MDDVKNEDTTTTTTTTSDQPDQASSEVVTKPETPEIPPPAVDNEVKLEDIADDTNADTVQAQSETPLAPAVSEPGTSSEPVQAVPETTEQPDNSVSSSESTAIPPVKNKSMLPVIVALLVALALVVLGYVAFKNTDSTSDQTNNRSSQPNLTQEASGPVNQAQVNNQLDEVNSLENDLNQLDSDLEAAELTDQNVGL